MLTIGMFGFWAYVLKHGADILEFDYPSRSIGHSIDKGVFIDTMDILFADTIKVNNFERNINIWPTASWIEKEVYWKSGEMDLDSIGLFSDTVQLVISFKNFVNGKEWAPKNNGFYIGELQNINGDQQSVYIDDNITRINFRMFIGLLKDTIRLTAKNEEQLVIKRRN